MSLLLWFALLVAPCLCDVCTEGECGSSPKSIEQLISFERVEERVWKSPSFVEVAKVRVPLVLKETVITSKWKAFQKWDSKYLKQEGINLSGLTQSQGKQVNLHNVFVSKNPTIWLYRDRENEIYSFKNVSQPYRLVNMTLSSLMQKKEASGPPVG